MDIYHELFHNALLVVAIAFGYWLIVVKWQSQRPVSRLASGILFGLAASAAMVLSFELQPGLIFDARSVVLSVAAMFGGPVVALVSAAMAAFHRLIIGGEGALVGVGVIVSSASLGLVAHHIHRHNLRDIGIPFLLVFGLAVHGFGILWFGLLGVDFVDVVLGKLALPYLGILTVFTVVIGLLLREIDRATHLVDIIRDRGKELEYLFDSAAIAILEEDLSEVVRKLDVIRASGVSDFRLHLLTTPGLLEELAADVRVLKANSAALTLFGVTHEGHLRRRIDEFFATDTENTFINELCAIWDKAPLFRGEVTFRRADGAIVSGVISFPLPRNPAEAKRVPVSILDLTEQKRNEAAIALERRRLSDVISGTKVGTWEWNIATGETVFNERWAEIIGFSLAELGPLSIETWKEFCHTDDLPISEAALAEVWNGEKDIYEAELRMRHRSGKWVWVLDRGNVIERDSNGRPLCMSGIHMDITTRKEAEIQALKVSNILQTLLRCHMDIILAKSESEMFSRTAATLATQRGYALVWFGIPESDPSKIIRQVASAGAAKSYLDNLEIHWANDHSGIGPAGRCVLAGQVQIVHKLQDQPDYSPWADKALSFGFQSSISAPIKVADEVVAVLNIYSQEEIVFTGEERILIEGFAADIGLAISVLRSKDAITTLNDKLAAAALNAIRAIAATIEQRDPYTAGHQESVAKLSEKIGITLGWDAVRLDGLRLGATIHDIGKIHIPAEILNRPGALSESEFSLIRDHAKIGYDILKHYEFPWPIGKMILQHHERLDGSGYPQGLVGDEIIDEAKILAVADVVDAITSHRPYRPSKGIEVAISEISKGRGTLFDADVVDACLKCLEDGEWGQDNTI